MVKGRQNFRILENLNFETDIQQEQQILILQNRTTGNQSMYSVIRTIKETVVYKECTYDAFYKLTQSTQYMHTTLIHSELQHRLAQTRLLATSSIFNLII